MAMEMQRHEQLGEAPRLLRLALTELSVTATRWWQPSHPSSNAPSMRPNPWRMSTSTPQARPSGVLVPRS
jgi:hypothetical protein